MCHYGAKLSISIRPPCWHRTSSDRDTEPRAGRPRLRHRGGRHRVASQNLCLAFCGKQFIDRLAAGREGGNRPRCKQSMGGPTQRTAGSARTPARGRISSSSVGRIEKLNRPRTWTLVRSLAMLGLQPSFFTFSLKGTQLYEGQENQTFPIDFSGKDTGRLCFIK